MGLNNHTLYYHLVRSYTTLKCFIKVIVNFYEKKYKNMLHAGTSILYRSPIDILACISVDELIYFLKDQSIV